MAELSRALDWVSKVVGRWFEAQLKILSIYFSILNSTLHYLSSQLDKACTIEIKRVTFKNIHYTVFPSNYIL